MSDVEIGWRRQTSSEVKPWAIDFSPAMDVGDVLGTTTATLTDLLTGLSFPTGLSGSTTVVGTVATQTVLSLVAGHNYRLVLTAGMGGSKESSVALLLSTPY